MRKTKIVITLNEQFIEDIDRLVSGNYISENRQRIFSLNS